MVHAPPKSELQSEVSRKHKDVMLLESTVARANCTEKLISNGPILIKCFVNTLAILKYYIYSALYPFA